MFCIQCEQTLVSDKFTGCQMKKGKCGKEAATADLQDILIYLLQGISQYAHRAREFGAIDKDVDHFIVEAFFTTLTNVNFDEDRFLSMIPKAVALREKAKAMYEQQCASNNKAVETLSGAAAFVPAQTKEGLLQQAEIASIKEDEAGADVFGLRCLILYGLKGAAAYAEHALMLGQEDEAVFAKFHEFLSFMASKPTDIDELLAVTLAVGEMNYTIMGLLDAGNTGSFGHPEPTQVRMNTIKGQAILVSGHDMVDLKALLEQTAGIGINVYTHGELLPANAYPEFKKYDHLVGNYGGAWQDQQKEFSEFPGAILMTSNCMIDPNVTGYGDRIFTCGPVGWPDVPHISDRDFSVVIASAKQQAGFKDDLIAKTITTGFASNAVLSVADKIVDGVKSGAIKHFFLIGGCDGAKPGRNYFSEFAEHTPDDTIMLTIGCGTFRFNDQQHGDIDGIPRLLDVGQCNDAYAAVQIALALADAFDCEVNDLPLTLIVSWFEQKAVAVLLTLLHLGIKNIHLGPTLPPFLSENLVNFLIEKFDLKPTGDAAEDIKNILAA